MNAATIGLVTYQRLCKMAWLTLGIIAAAISSLHAQNEYLATLNDQNLAVTRLANIPGVTYVIGHSTYDGNAGRFFFQGNATGAIPFNLYTLDAATGAVLSQPVSPATTDPLDQVLGLQYDNATDTLYGIYDSHTQGALYFCWIEPATGIIHTRNVPALTSFQSSSFDIRDHLYIVAGTTAQGSRLVAINAATGAVVYSSAFSISSNVNDLIFNNTTHKLYAVCLPPTASNPQFDSIGLANGIEYKIADLPAATIPDIGTGCIDEAGGKYFFVGNDPVLSPCHSEHFFTLDINTGSVLSDQIYPYADAAGNPYDENVIEYSFDQGRELLYALNWHIPGTPPPGSFSINASANPACQGAPVTFTGVSGSGFIQPSYQWYLNGNPVGTNNTIYVNNGVADGDLVYCTVTNNPVCSTALPYTSNSVHMQVTAHTDPAITIRPSVTTICSGSPVTFTSTPVNEGISPVYTWLINGLDAGTNSPVFTSSSLINGDLVSCRLTSGENCLSSATSNTVTMTVNQTPMLPEQLTSVITASANPACQGQDIAFTAASGSNTLTNPTYQWTLNGSDVGTNSATYENSQLATGDLINCIITDYPLCSATTQASSNNIRMLVDAIPPAAALTIEASFLSVCSGDPVTFKATAMNGGPAPVYQWQVNSMDAGVKGDSFTDPSLVTGDLISCILTTGLACSIPVASGNTISMTVNPRPTISFAPDTLIVKPGSSTLLDPSITNTTGGTMTGNMVRFSWTPATGLDNQAIPGPMASPESTITYQLTVTGADGCQASAKQTILVYYVLNMPNAFTPNGDGINDLFRIPPATPQKIKTFSIYNRWGQLVFSTHTSTDGWDGTFDKHSQEAGAYVWNIEYTDLLTDRSFTASGTVVLIR